MEKFYFKSFIGIIEILAKDGFIVSSKIIKKIGKDSTETELIKNIKKQLKEYFSGKRKEFDVKIKPEGTEFQKKVWKKLIEIPYGMIKTYCEVAKEIGNKNAFRAVGNACNKNPIIIFIPCHRVIAKSGKLSGFAYGIDIKEKLFNLEKINN